MTDDTEDTGWTEAAREAARLAKEAAKKLAEPNEPKWHKEMRERNSTNISAGSETTSPWSEATKGIVGSTTRAVKEAMRNARLSGEERQAARIGHEQEWRKFNSDDYPYKSVERNKKGEWKPVGWHNTFAEAYTHPQGTHVMQTHGTTAELEQQLRGTSSPASSATGPSTGVQMASGAAAGWLLAGPLGAAIGAMVGADRKPREQQFYKLPNPIITPKPLRE